MNILFFDKLPSTNRYALDIAEQGTQTETVVWASEQTAGRGQYDRQFSSPPGGLYFSLILQPDLPLHTLSLVTLAAGVGCCCCLENLCAVAPLLKWPNDLYIHGKKVGGILVEALPFKKDLLATVIIGVGLNINSIPEDFPEELSTTVTSIADCTQKTHELEPTLKAIVSEILMQIHLLEKNQDKLLAQWHKRDYLKGQSLTWDNGQTTISGIGQGILSDGRYAMIDGYGNIHEILAGTLRPG